VILQIGQTGIFVLALEIAGRPGLARRASSARAATLVKRLSFEAARFAAIVPGGNLA
jgi:hypothetical protein